MSSSKTRLVRTTKTKSSIEDKDLIKQIFHSPYFWVYAIELDLSKIYDK